jgi:hypothetical protein
VTGLLRQKQRNEVVLGESDERGAIHRIFRIAVPPFVNRNFAPTRGSSGRPVASNSAVSVTPKPEAATTPGQLPKRSGLARKASSSVICRAACTASAWP